MFTGIVQDIGEIESLEPREGDLVIGIRPSALNTTLVKLGDLQFAYHRADGDN